MRRSVVAVLVALALATTFPVATAAASKQTDSQWWKQWRFTVAVVLDEVNTMGKEVTAGTWERASYDAGQVARLGGGMFYFRQPALPGFSEWKPIMTSMLTYQSDVEILAKTGGGTLNGLATEVNGVAAGITLLDTFMKAHHLSLPN